MKLSCFACISWLFLAAISGAACANEDDAAPFRCGPKLPSTGRCAVESVGHSMGAPLPPPPTVTISPLDGTTDLAHAVRAFQNPAITVSAYSGAIERNVMEALASGARVVSNASGEAIAVDLAYSSPGLQGAETTSIELVPREPLAKGWYTLEVDEPEPPLVWRTQPTTEFELLQGGIARTRFRVGSDPRVLTISACDKADNITAFYLYTSEEVSSVEPVEDHVRIDAGGKSLECDPSLATSGRGYVRVACKLDGADALRVSLNDAFRSSANPAQPLAAATASFDVSLTAALATTEGCKTVKLPLTTD